jgi:hypothetical protein
MSCENCIHFRKAKIKRKEFFYDKAIAKTWIKTVVKDWCEKKKEVVANPKRAANCKSYLPKSAVRKLTENFEYYDLRGFGFEA